MQVTTFIVCTVAALHNHYVQNKGELCQIVFKL